MKIETHKLEYDLRMVDSVSDCITQVHVYFGWMNCVVNPQQLVLETNSATNEWNRVSKSYQDFQTAANIAWNNNRAI